MDSCVITITNYKTVMDPKLILAERPNAGGLLCNPVANIPYSAVPDPSETISCEIDDNMSRLGVTQALEISNGITNTMLFWSVTI